MTKLSDLTDFEINKRVTIALNIDMHFFISESEDSFDSEVLLSERGPIWQTSAHVVLQYRPSNGNCFNPCNNWSDAGPIIVEYRISIDCIHDQGEKWLAFSGDDCEYRSTHKNPLRAAMIVFLEMQ